MNLNALPPLSPLAPGLLTIDLDSDQAFGKLTQIIESDPSLSARLIAAANSAAYGLPGHRFVTIEAAAGRIGLRRSVQLAVALLVGNAVNRKLSASMSQALWLHALTLATAAQEIARVKQTCEPAQAYFVGLMHDVGYMAMEFLQPGCLTEIVARMSRENISLEQAETRTFGAEHPFVAGMLLNDWKLPQEVIEPIQQHHNMDVAPDSMAAILFGAEKIARCEDVVEVLYAGLDHPFRPMSMDRIGIEFLFDQQLDMSSDAVDQLIERIVDQVEGLREASQAMVGSH